MTSTHTHNPNNHLSRRASISTAPYQIPQRHNSISHSHSPLSPPTSSNIHIPVHHNRPIPTGVSHNPQHPQQQQHQLQQQQNAIHTHNGHAGSNGQPLSSSVPVLSREFVVRRISEGESGRLKEELKCEACGKGYKHISSLAKHLWEHTPEWNVTKKLLISKHQQVQLLEAASILVSMNEMNPIEEEESTEQSQTQTQSSSSIRFNPKYTEDHDDDDDDDDEDEEEGDISRSSNSPSPYLKEQKFRNGSISQFPPSESIQNSNSPMTKKIHTGGFLDVPKANGHSNAHYSNGNGKSMNGKGSKIGSISEESRNVENKENEQAVDDDEGVFGMD